MLVKEIMSKNIISVKPEDTVFEAAMKYKEYKVGCLLVMKEKKCIGIITERDIIERTICENKNPAETKIYEIMSKNIISIHSLENIEKAINLMRENNIKKLPVVHNDSIIGIITVTDISKARPDLSDRFIKTWVKQRWED